jgi:hypothetical protein
MYLIIVVSYCFKICYVCLDLVENRICLVVYMQLQLVCTGDEERRGVVTNAAKGGVQNVRGIAS